MDLIGSLSQVAMGNTVPTKAIKDMKIYYEYPVTKIKHVTTRYGPRFVVHIFDELDCEYVLYLPPRMRSAFEEDEKMLDHVKKLIIEDKLFIKYLGRDKYDRLEFRVKN